jgi:hypothetical protein
LTLQIWFSKEPYGVPTLWNVFYEDARKAIQETFFTEVIFADDLNAYREFPESTPKDKILESLKKCQTELHDWGKANQVAFDPGKESFHIISKNETYGGNFKMLGVHFDTGLTMQGAVDELVTDAGWKLKMLVKTRRFYTDADLIILYKTHLLSFLEYRTPAVYHATRDILAKLDRIQTKFLQEAGVSEKEALMEFNLAPLETRRDIAMLGVIHRTAMGRGPRHFRIHFQKQQDGYIKDPRAELKGAVVQRSAFGLVAVYNALPAKVKASHTVSNFQQRLQDVLKQAAVDGILEWPKLLSPRSSLDNIATYSELLTCLA